MSSPTRFRPLTAGLLLGAFLAPSALGMSATPIALPALGADLGVAPGVTAWVLAAYTLTLSVSTALSGRVADLRGLRPPIVVGMGVLVAGTLVLLLPHTATVLTGRLLQGVGAGVAAVGTFAVAGEAFPDPESRGKVLGTVGFIVGIVSGGGALLGGALTDLVGWQAALALPVLSAAAAVPVLRLAPRRTPKDEPLDVTGAALVVVLAAALLFLLQAPSTHLGGALIVVCAIVALTAAGAVVWHVRRRPAGFLPARVIGNPRFTTAAAAGFTLFAAYLIMQFAAPRLILADSRLTATQVGLVLLPAGVASAVVSRAAARLAVRVGALRLVAALTVLSAAGLVLAGLLSSSVVFVVVAVAACVSGFSAGQVALMGAVPQLVDPAVRGVAVGGFQLLFLVGGSLGTAAVGGLTGPLPLAVALLVLAVVPLLGTFCAEAARRLAGRGSVPDIASETARS